MPEMGARNRCRTCQGDIVWYEYAVFNGVEIDVLDSWWAHLEHPEDDHDAVVDPTWGRTGGS